MGQAAGAAAGEHEADLRALRGRRPDTAAAGLRGLARERLCGGRHEQRASGERERDAGDQARDAAIRRNARHPHAVGWRCAAVGSGTTRMVRRRGRGRGMDMADSAIIPAAVSADGAPFHGVSCTRMDSTRASADVGYTRVAIAFHWLAVLLIVGGFSLGLWMVEQPLAPSTLRMYGYHKWIGITVFLLALVRLGWRWTRPAPPPVAMPEWQRRAATITHWALYVLMLAIPLSGWVYSSATGVQVVYLGLVPLPNLVEKNKALAAVLKALHFTLNFTLLVLVVMHVGAALKHHIVDRDGVLVRICRSSRGEERVRDRETASFAHSCTCGDAAGGGRRRAGGGRAHRQE